MAASINSNFPPMRQHRSMKQDMYAGLTPQKAAYRVRDLVQLIVDNNATSIVHKISDDENDELWNCPADVAETQAAVGPHILKYYPILDKAFFFNAVHHEVTTLPLFDTEWQTAREIAAGIKPFGIIQGSFSLQNMEIRMNINALPATALGTRGQQVLGTLVHEMLHAFLRVFGCRTCQECRDAHGITGHGWHFAMSLATILYALQRDYAWHIDAGLRSAMDREARAGGPVYTDAQLIRLGLRPLSPAARARADAWKRKYDAKNAVNPAPPQTPGGACN